MTNVTNVLLTCSKRDEGNAFLAMQSFKGKASISRDLIAAAWLLRDVRGQQIRDALAQVKWLEPAAVRLLIQEQGDAAFSVWCLHDRDKQDDAIAPYFYYVTGK